MVIIFEWSEYNGKGENSIKVTSVISLVVEVTLILYAFNFNETTTQCQLLLGVAITNALGRCGNLSWLFLGYVDFFVY